MCFRWLVAGLPESVRQLLRVGSRMETLDLPQILARARAVVRDDGASGGQEVCLGASTGNPETTLSQRCFVCNGANHFARDCLARRDTYSGSSQRSARRTSRRGVRCYSCGVLGNIASACQGNDRDQIVNAVLKGYGNLGNDHPISLSNRYYASELPQRKYDPDKAKFHMKKAGIPGHIFKLHVAEAGFPGAVDAAVLYKEHAAKAGINIEIVREPNDGYWSNIWKKKPWCACYWSGRPTEDWMFSWTYATGAKQNDTFWKHDRFNKLLREARSELDEKKRREMYVEMQRIVRDEGGAVIPMFANNVEAATTKLKFEKPAGNWELDGLKLVERWWFGS